jgi:hypothetical protein
MKGKIFNAQEVQSIIAGTKTMFREVIKKTQIDPTSQLNRCGTELLLSECPYQVGQKIFCKEAWGRKATGSGIAYKADNPNQLIYQHLAVKWNLPQHMKQEHSRIILEIIDIKVERLAEISNADCRSEGEDQWSFICNWNATHKKPEEKFEANPFAWVVDFKITNN